VVSLLNLMNSVSIAAIALAAAVVKSMAYRPDISTLSKTTCPKKWSDQPRAI
jgi:hypothetical protein